MAGPDPLCASMLIATHRQLQRHRRKMLWAAAVFTTAALSLTAGTVLASDHAHGGMDRGVDDAALVCIMGAGCVAVLGMGAGTFTHQPPSQQPLWAIDTSPAPASAFVGMGLGFLVRAGPWSALREIFRL